MPANPKIFAGALLSCDAIRWAKVKSALIKLRACARLMDISLRGLGTKQDLVHAPTTELSSWCWSDVSQDPDTMQLAYPVKKDRWAYSRKPKLKFRISPLSPAF